MHYTSEILATHLDESFVFETHHFFQTLTKKAQVGILTFWLGLIKILSYKHHCDTYCFVSVSRNLWALGMYDLHGSRKLAVQNGHDLQCEFKTQIVVRRDKYNAHNVLHFNDQTRVVKLVCPVQSGLQYTCCTCL